MVRKENQRKGGGGDSKTFDSNNVYLFIMMEFVFDTTPRN